MINKKIMISLLGIVSILAISFTGANLIGDYTVKQKVIMDTVDISVSEKMHSNNELNELIDFSFNGYIEPTQEIEKLTSVKNKGSECFVRFKVEVFRNKEKIRNINLDEMIHLNNNFIYCDDEYYYLKTSLKENEEVNILDGLIMPTEELHMIKDDENDRDKNISFIMTVDSIQTRGFKQDLTSVKPWQGTNIQKTVKTRLESEIR